MTKTYISTNETEALTEHFFSRCEKICFGKVSLDQDQREFQKELNNEIISLCKSLPDPVHTDALLFFWNYLKIQIGEKINFCDYFYTPTWSFVFWLIQRSLEENALNQLDIENVKTGHSMAMFLHAIDDHLNDGELPATHLNLLLRSQAWTRMYQSMDALATDIDGDNAMVRIYLADYYSGILHSIDVESLDSYCDLFRKQMATGFIAPHLILKKLKSSEELVNDMLNAYGSFGIAWRLLDDINDIEEDILEGSHSAIYVCLPDPVKELWDEAAEDKKTNDLEVILNHFVETGVVEKVKERICSELESAAAISIKHDFNNLADEFRSLAQPLRG